jgi:hypothetical protein
LHAFRKRNQEARKKETPRSRQKRSVLLTSTVEQTL